jgi:hypothetical protein
LSNKIKTLYVENEFSAIKTARISVNKIWFLCPVLVCYEVTAVQGAASIDQQSFPSSCLQHSLILCANRPSVHAGQRNVTTRLNAIYHNMMKDESVISVSKFSDWFSCARKKMRCLYCRLVVYKLQFFSLEDGLYFISLYIAKGFVLAKCESYC